MEEKKREIRITIKVTAEEKRRIDTKAAKCGLDRSSYMRYVALTYQEGE